MREKKSRLNPLGGVALVLANRVACECEKPSSGPTPARYKVQMGSVHDANYFVDANFEPAWPGFAQHYRGPHFATK